MQGLNVRLRTEPGSAAEAILACAGARDGVSGCRDCCGGLADKHGTDVEEACVDVCMGAHPGSK